MMVVEMSLCCAISNSSNATFGLLWNQMLTVHWHQSSFSVCATRIWKKSIKMWMWERLGGFYFLVYTTLKLRFILQVWLLTELNLNICFASKPGRIILLLVTKTAYYTDMVGNLPLNVLSPVRSCVLMNSMFLCVFFLFLKTSADLWLIVAFTILTQSCFIDFSLNTSFKKMGKIEHHSLELICP